MQGERRSPGRRAADRPGSIRPVTDAPDFLVIGAARSGTTALTSFLGEHPDVFVSTPKEPHFLAFPGGAPRFVGTG